MAVIPFLPPAHLSPSTALQLSQQAPAILRSAPSSITSYPVSWLWATAESPELWTAYENLMISCLRTGDEQSAHLCLQRLTERFGAENERLMALRGLFQEATATDDGSSSRYWRSIKIFSSKTQVIWLVLLTCSLDLQTDRSSLYRNDESRS